MMKEIFGVKPIPFADLEDLQGEKSVPWKLGSIEEFQDLSNSLKCYDFDKVAVAFCQWKKLKTISSPDALFLTESTLSFVELKSLTQEGRFRDLELSRGKLIEEISKKAYAKADPEIKDLLKIHQRLITSKTNNQIYQIIGTHFHKKLASIPLFAGLIGQLIFEKEEVWDIYQHNSNLKVVAYFIIDDVLIAQSIAAKWNSIGKDFKMFGIEIRILSLMAFCKVALPLLKKDSVLN